MDPSRKPKFAGVMGFLKPVGEKVEKAMWGDNVLRKPAGAATLAERMGAPVRCGWCQTHYESRPGSPNCPSCGGVLPLRPGSDSGAPPPVPPRKLPKAFLIGIPILLFGLVQTWYRFIKAYRQHRSLTRGSPVPGRIESVTRFGPAEAGNHGSVLYRVYLRFDSGYQGVLGIKWTYDPTITEYFTGDPVWVVTVPGKPQYCSIWPPLA